MPVVHSLLPALSHTCKATETVAQAASRRPDTSLASLKTCKLRAHGCSKFLWKR